MAGGKGWSKKGHGKVPKIEQPRVNADVLLELLKNPLRRLFRKASLAGTPDYHGNNGHVFRSWRIVAHPPRGITL
jgi:hypothetical protein